MKKILRYTTLIQLVGAILIALLGYDFSIFLFATTVLFITLGYIYQVPIYAPWKDMYEKAGFRNMDLYSCISVLLLSLIYMIKSFMG